MANVSKLEATGRTPAMRIILASRRAVRPVPLGHGDVACTVGYVAPDLQMALINADQIDLGELIGHARSVSSRWPPVMTGRGLKDYESQIFACTQDVDGPSCRRSLWLSRRCAGGGEVAGQIEYLCIADHEWHDESAITLVEGLWAFCRRGGAADGHEWKRIKPTDYAELRTLGPSALHDLVARSRQHEESRRT